MKPKSLSLALVLLGGTSMIALADPIITGDVTSNLGPAFFIDAASTGGGDFAINEPGTANFDRSLGILNVGTGGSTISVTGIGWATLNNAGANDATSATVTITYLGADGVFGGIDDVLIGTATDNFTFAANGEYYWKFTSPLTNVIDGSNNIFRVAITPSNGTTNGSLSFKTSLSNPNGNASNVKLSVAGTSAIVGSPLVDTDTDGIIDVYETNTGIYVSPLNTGTDPNDNDTDNDGLLDGVETNTGVWVSAGNTGTNPHKGDTDNDGLLDGVETNSGTFASVSNTGTNPHNRDTDADRLGDAYEVTNGLNPTANADFDSDTFSDALEVLFYGSDPKLVTSFPGDGISPAPGTFTPILNGGATITPGGLDIPSTLGTAILNEAAAGGDIDANFNNGVTNFVLSFEDLFPAAGSTVSLTGFAWQVVTGTNASGDILLQFFDPGADGVVDGIDKDTLVGTAKGTLTVTGTSTVMYWNFSSPVNFTSAGTGLMIKIQSTAPLRIKAQDNLASGVWYANDGRSTFGTNRSSRVSIGGTAIAPSTGFSGWQTANNTTGTLDEDHDNDGASNGVEYFLEGETDTTGFTPLPGVANNSVTWTKAASYNGVYDTDFEVETSTTLEGAWTPVTEGVGAGFVEITGNDVKYTFPAGPKNFVRLKITGP
ncbi:MAG: hypothetical protein MUF13_04200 [Akkermansiaceae bacterium]|jgi:hypothetical protein|nr:hypothetical protein [Akkermansiaceae bacterium]